MTTNEYITVVVLCFNSSYTVLETLESIKNQTYKYLNLYINDDCSDDDSIEKICIWLKNNKERFGETKLITHETNQGINKSFDDVLRISPTKWVKPIAGDDILLETCIEDNINYVINEGIETIVYSYQQPFVSCNGKNIQKKEDFFEKYYLEKIATYVCSKQYKALLKKDINFSSTVFINKDIYIEIGGINLEIKNVEDWPLRLLFTKNEKKLYLLKKYTVLYRIGDSISHSSENFYNLKHIQQKKRVKELLVYPNISHIHILFYLNEYITDFRLWIIIHLFKNKKTVLSIIVNKFLMMFDTGKWIKAIYNILHTRRKYASN